jgi:hypothetical protein
MGKGQHIGGVASDFTLFKINSQITKGAFMNREGGKVFVSLLGRFDVDNVKFDDQHNCNLS